MRALGGARWSFVALLVVAVVFLALVLSFNPPGAVLTLVWHSIGILLIAVSLLLWSRRRRASLGLGIVVSIYEGIIPFGVLGLPSIAAGQIPAVLAPLFIVGLVSALSLLYFSATGLRVKV